MEGIYAQKTDSFQHSILDYNFDLKYWKQKFDTSANKLIILISLEELNPGQDYVEVIKKFMRTIDKISTFAHEHDFKNVQYNGYRSFVKLWAKVMEASLTIDSKSGRNEFLDSLKRLDFIHSHLMDYHNQNQGSNFNTGQQKKCFRRMNEEFIDENVWKIFRSAPFKAIQLSGSMKFAIGLLDRFHAILLPRTTILEKVIGLVSTKSAVKTLAEYYVKMNVNDTSYILSWGDTIGNIIGFGCNIAMAMFPFDAHMEVKTVVNSIRSQYDIDVNVDGMKIVRCEIDDIKTSNIRYQIIRNKPVEESKYDKKMLLYLHGGAFIGPKADVFEHVYIRSWARSMPGLTVVNFDYSLCPGSRFPKPVQELLDFYIWLISDSSKDEVTKTFGFLPEEIVFGGESSGGHIVTSFMIVLSELKQLHDGALRMPKGILLVYPKISMNCQIYPSTLLTLFDPLLVPAILPIVYHSYVPMGQYDGSTDGYRLLPLEEQTKLPSKASTMDETFMIENVLLNPLQYEKFEMMKNVNLHIITVEFDPFLDEGILLARKWEGKVNFRVLSDLSHSSSVWRLIDNDGKKSADEVIDLIKESFFD